MPHEAERSALTLSQVLKSYFGDGRVLSISRNLIEKQSVFIKGAAGSSLAFILYSAYKVQPGLHIMVARDKEEAAYLLNDLETIKSCDVVSTPVNLLFYPSSWKRPFDIEHPDTGSIQLRAECLNQLRKSENCIVVTTLDALLENVIGKDDLDKNSITLSKGERISLTFLTDLLFEYGFTRSDYVIEPGQFAVRGGIIDVHSFAADLPFRIEFSGDEVESIRTFDPATQLTNSLLDSAPILPNITDKAKGLKPGNLLDFTTEQHPEKFVWIDDPESLNKYLPGDLSPEAKNTLAYSELQKQFSKIPCVYYSPGSQPKESTQLVSFKIKPQPDLNKNFKLFFSQLSELKNNSYQSLVCFDTFRQSERLEAIFESMFPGFKGGLPYGMYIKPDQGALTGIHEGFIDPELNLAVFTDHQLFGRYHRFHLKNSSFKKSDALTLKMLKSLQPGDFVTHIDHGIGRFGGLEKIELPSSDGVRLQESIRLVYKDNDTLYISIHSLHQISRYGGKEAEAPKLDKLGSGAWSTLKNRTKKKIKELAFDLVKLYAKRKSQPGFAFKPDTYLQNELEASFIYEDTPDQVKANQDVKRDMEAGHPMDRLICGDVGFGKTEIAVRAAFKAATDGKQTTILVPTTILALQHFKTFSERLKGFPCTVDYINRFRSAKEQKESLKKLAEGKTDILIGTHRLLGKDLKFKDLGLLIVDEEQKFGVGAKDKLKLLKENVDTLTLSATPIPRTLQFSMMGARDMSMISTPPPNRYPVVTEVHLYNEKIIRDALEFELQRGGQVFFVHNRVQNIGKYAEAIKRLIPKAKILVAHGQMKGEKLEKSMLDFIDGEYDILVCTTIVESGLDIPNANTIVINDAQNYGLSDLHQLRGRVGRSNKKAFCYLLTPSFTTLTKEARKRLRAIEEFSDLGSGLHVAMRDLDIRGAGNLLGAEQSGFISDIGYETYQKILDEALDELKTEANNKQLAEGSKLETTNDGNPSSPYVKDCAIDTDLSLLIPEDYVENITERIALYRELDSCKTEEELMAFASRLKDRFGTIPDTTLKLIDVVRLRWLAMQLGMEKLVLKNGRLIAWFVSNKDSFFYQSPVFSKILQYVQDRHDACSIEEGKNKLTLKIEDVKNISNAMNIFSKLN